MSEPHAPWCWCLLIGNLHIHFHPLWWCRLNLWSGHGDRSLIIGPLTFYHTGTRSYDIGCGKGEPK